MADASNKPQINNAIFVPCLLLINFLFKNISPVFLAVLMCNLTVFRLTVGYFTLIVKNK